MTDAELLETLVAVRRYLAVAQKAFYDPFDEARVLYAKMRDVEKTVKELVEYRAEERAADDEGIGDTVVDVNRK